MFKNETFIVLHHFLDSDQPKMNCILPSSSLCWNDVILSESSMGQLFSYLEDKGFSLFLPQQAAIDAVRNDEDVSLHSPKHKFQIFCFGKKCNLLIEIYLMMDIAPYGAFQESISYPEDMCQLELEFSFEKNAIKKKAKSIDGENLDILHEVPKDLVEAVQSNTLSFGI
ncbi:hypothetical protein [Paenibacillus albidus]|nr:hypothetical protein [Paenibacillus albidus]